MGVAVPFARREKARRKQRASTMARLGADWHRSCTDHQVEVRRTMALDSVLQPRYRLLVAEDDKAMREMLVALLRADGYEVMAVSNGLELLHALEVSLDPESGKGVFDLVVSDVRMPGTSGPGAFLGIRYGRRAPPVLFMTAFGDDDLGEEAIHIDVLAVLDKPFDFDELRAFVRSYLTRRYN